jgi:large subunit ribosomal protein L21
MSSSYAIVESGGKQYRVEKGDTLLVDRLREDEGSKVNLRAVMYRGDGDVVLSGGDLEKVKVEAKIAAHERGPKLRVFKYKAKKGYRKRAGHRSELTRLEVTDLRKLSRRPAAGAQKAKAEGGEPSAAKPAAKKAADSGAKRSAAAKAEAGEAKPPRAAEKAKAKPAARTKAKPAGKDAAGGAKASGGSTSGAKRRTSQRKKES